MNCPHCGSSNLAYAEDVTTTYVIAEYVGRVVRIEPEGATSDEPFNLRLVCIECHEEIELPDGTDVEVVEDFGAPVADPDEGTETQS